MRAGLHLLAEQLVESGTLAAEAIERGEQLLTDRSITQNGPTWEAVADARVTLASLAEGGPHPATDETVASALTTLDRVARDPVLSRTPTAARAINNALSIRLHLARDLLHTTDGQVEAWMHVSESRTLIRDCPDQGAVLRQAVDLGMRCGQWERAWSSAREQIADETERNELIAVLAKAALLAWHREDRQQARALGQRAQSLSVAVDHPWVRTYAYLGGVIAATCGSGAVESALTGYARCTSIDGHATRPDRAWLAAWVALDSGHPVDQVKAFLRETLPGGLHQSNTDQASVLFADARGHDVDAVVAERILSSSASLPDQARVHLALARTHRRQARPTAAAVELMRARSLLAYWPGWLLARVKEEAVLAEEPVRATAAQRQVLDLLAEGLSNQQIAALLGLSTRTVAVHVGALLKANDQASRTGLVARHLRAAMAHK